VGCHPAVRSLAGRLMVAGVRKPAAAQLAAAVGVTPAHIFKLESGRGEPSVALLRRLASALDVDLGMLLPAG
jgi:transcriptional regulator with XRE-family HTH domain